MVPIFQLSRTGSSDNLHWMNDCHNTARSSDLSRRLYCLPVGFLTTQAFYPPPNKVAKRPAFELSCQTELVTYKAKARVSLFEARAFSLLWVLAKRYHVGLYAIAGYSRWQASMTLGPFLGGVGNEKT